jgi:hypothetical protein
MKNNVRRDCSTESHREERGGEGENTATCEPLGFSPGSCPPGSVASVPSVAETTISSLAWIVDSQSGLAVDRQGVAGVELASFGADGVEKAASGGGVSSLKCQVSSDSSDLALQTSHLKLAKPLCETNPILERMFHIDSDLRSCRNVICGKLRPNL